MLTRQERQEIAERAKACKKEEELNWDQFSYVLLGIQSWRNDDELLDRIVELCDTSNMIELPRDRDGEVIKVGDTVYDKDGKVAKVGGYYHNHGNWKIIIPFGQNGCFVNVLPNELIHKKPVTIKSLVEELRSALCAAYISGRECEKILYIADQLESLSDKDE